MDNNYSDFQSKKVNVRFDKGRLWRGHLGVVLLAMEQTVDMDVLKLVPEGIGVHFGRVKMPNAVTVENLIAAGEALPEAASLIVPDLKLDAIGYGCTSGTFCIGGDYAKSQLLKRGNVDTAVTMFTAVLNALRAIGAKKIAIATPYLDEVNAVEGKYLENEGFTITNLQEMNLTNDTDIVLTSTDFIKEFAMGVNTPDADAVFISCGALRSVDVIDELEKALNKPVITSNQAFTWDLLRSAGFNDQFDGYGVLFKEY